MRRAVLTLLALALGCACGAEPDGAPVTLAPAESDSDRSEPVLLSPVPELEYATKRAVYRWNVASGCGEGSGCEVVLGEGGIPVAYADEIVSAKGTRAQAVTCRGDEGANVCTRGQVAVFVRRGNTEPERLVAHEVGHLRGGHHTETGVMWSADGMSAAEKAAIEAMPYRDLVERFAITRIDAASLHSVCERQRCLGFTPED